MNGWERLGGVSPARLIEARLQLHHAAQPAAAVGKLLLPHQADFSEQSFRWSAAGCCLAQGAVAAPTPFRAALRLAPPALRLLGTDERVLRELPLGGCTSNDAYDWLAAQLAELLGGPLDGELERPEGLPAHPLADGGRFDAGDAEAFAELARLFANADRVLAAWAAAWPGASAVRCWPHHFDIATLAPIVALVMHHAAAAPRGANTSYAPVVADPESTRTIGVGMVPGDAGRAQPYFYVTPWPRPEDRDLPPLAPGGTWHTEGWLGAVLEAPRFVAPDRAPQQAAVVQSFLSSAADACRLLLE